MSSVRSPRHPPFGGCVASLHTLHRLCTAHLAARLTVCKVSALCCVQAHPLGAVCPRPVLTSPAPVFQHPHSRRRPPRVASGRPAPCLARHWQLSHPRQHLYLRQSPKATSRALANLHPRHALHERLRTLVAGAQRCAHHHDLHPCAEGGSRDFIRPSAGQLAHHALGQPVHTQNLVVAQRLPGGNGHLAFVVAHV